MFLPLLLYLCLEVKGSVHLNDTHKVALSSVSCEGGDGVNRRCIFENLIFHGSKFYYVYADKDKPPFIPKIRSSVSNLFEYRLWQPSFVSLRNTSGWEVSRAPFERAIVWRLLNPTNWYHFLFDDYGPILRLRSLSFGTPIDEKSNDQLVFLNQRKLPDGFEPAIGWMFNHITSCIHQYQRAVQVSQTAIGTQSMCGHRGHCTQRMEPGSLISLRDAVFKHLEKSDGVKSPAPVVRGVGREQVKIGVIQRASYRRFQNLDRVMAETPLLKSVTPIYLENVPVVEQARLFSSLDLTLMMHGGAIGNWLFLKPGSVVIDVHPFGHSHPLTQWIVEDLQSLNITFISFYLQEEATVRTPRFVEMVSKIYPEIPAHVIRDDPTWKCPPGDANKQARCKNSIFFQGNFDLNPQDISELLDLGISSRGKDHRFIKAYSHGLKGNMTWDWYPL
jgi:hypothetical protein